MNLTLEGKTVIIIGATGGLGESIATAFFDNGSNLLLAGRNIEKLDILTNKLNSSLLNNSNTMKNERKVLFQKTDITQVDDISNLLSYATNNFSQIDIVINVSGCDIRKSIDDHTYEDIYNTINTNLLGSILLTKIFISSMKDIKDSLIVHIGGFADGRLAFPYYSVDVATRSGLFTFIESINRELELESAKTRVSFFSPSPSDTEAERPFHQLWHKMNIRILHPDIVAKDLIKTIVKKKSVFIMGGVSTVLLAKINSIMPKLADKIILKKYGLMLREFLYGKNPNQNSNSKGIINKIAILLIILSFIFYGLIILIPFLPLTLSMKAIIIPILIACGEITWWIGVAIVGKQVITKYKKYFNPLNLFRCKKC